MTKTQRTGVWHGVLAICIAAGFAAAAVPCLWAQVSGQSTPETSTHDAAADNTGKLGTGKPATWKLGPANVEALFVSDIHFEPFWDPAKAAKLMAAPVSEWNAILAAPESADQAARFAELQATCKARGADSSYTLYEGSLKAIHENANGAKFVVLSGDLIAHNFSCKFDTTFPKAKPGEYRAFVEKTIEYVMRELRAALPGVPVYAALGNNDSDCGDYELDANGAFLADIGKTLTADFPAKERGDALRDFSAGGYYSVRLPAPLDHTQILVLDDLFMSRQYMTCGGKADPAPAAAQIAWLTQQLIAARRSHEKVWVMSHIPPGVNPYATATKVLDLCSGGKPTMFLNSEAPAEAMAGYGDVITLAIFAHTHMDEMRLLKPAAGDPPEGVAIKMVGSISPVNGNNPSFTVAQIDAATAQLKDYRVFVASNLTAPDASPNSNTGTQWSEEYDFAQAYKKPAFTAATVADLVAGFKADPTAQSSASQSYIRNYGSGAGGARAIGAFWQPYTCALRNDGADAFRSCVCQGSQ
jgi:sphingomyelin phosphodiesterase acid-like 3